MAFVHCVVNIPSGNAIRPSVLNRIRMKQTPIISENKLEAT